MTELRCQVCGNANRRTPMEIFKIAMAIVGAILIGLFAFIFTVCALLSA